MSLGQFRVPHYHHENTPAISNDAWGIMVFSLDHPAQNHASQLRTASHADCPNLPTFKELLHKIGLDSAGNRTSICMSSSSIPRIEDGSLIFRPKLTLSGKDMEPEWRSLQDSTKSHTILAWPFTPLPCLTDGIYTRSILFSYKGALGYPICVWKSTQDKDVDHADECLDSYFSKELTTFTYRSAWPGYQFNSIQIEKPDTKHVTRRNLIDEIYKRLEDFVQGVLVSSGITLQDIFLIGLTEVNHSKEKPYWSPLLGLRQDHPALM